jgi:hypothetical protein
VHQTRQSAFHRFNPDLAIQRAKLRSLFTRARLTPHPIARLEPRLPRQGPTARFELPRRSRLVTGCPAPHRTSEKDASLRLLQPTHDTSTHCAARFPIPLPSRPAALRPRDTPFTRPGGASLDGDPPASALPQPERRILGRSPISASFGHRAVLVREPRSKALPRRASRAQPSQPRASMLADL